MVTLNGRQLYDVPGSCGSCPFFNSGSSSLCPQQRGFCDLWGEMHNCWINPPRKCLKLFNKAVKMPEGSNLVIVLD